MSMPPQSPPGPPHNNAYGSGGPPRGAWDQNQAQQYPDPYQQQYDAFAQSNPGQQSNPQQGPQQGYGPGQIQGHYGQPAMVTPSNPAGPGWNQPPRNSNKLPWIVGAAIVAIGAIVAAVVVITGKDENNSADPSPAAEQSQTQGDSPGSSAPDESEAPTDPAPSKDESDETDPVGSPGGSGSLPAGIPVPASVSIDDSATFCSGDSCLGSFESDDPEAAYDDWISELESAGYTITAQEISGSGSDIIWAIEATGELEIILYWIGSGSLASTST